MAQNPNPSLDKEDLKKQMEDEKNSQPAKLFQEETFKDYVKEKYLLENEEIMKNSTILQMIYSLEWYDIPRTSYSDLIEFHPYLTKGDHDKLFFINMQHRIENGISMLLFSLISNRLLMNRSNFLKKRYIRTPFALATGGLLTYFFNYLILRPIYLSDLDELGLSQKYFFLDLDADMMREDLEKFGIKPKAQYYNKEEIEQRLTQQFDKAEHKINN